MTLNDLFNQARQGNNGSMIVEIVMKDVYLPGTVPYVGTVIFRVNRAGQASFSGATREEYGKASPSRLGIQIISLATPAAPNPNPAHLAIIMPLPPFVPPNDALGAESFVPNTITPSVTNGVAFENTTGSIRVILHK